MLTMLQLKLKPDVCCEIVRFPYVTLCIVNLANIIDYNSTTYHKQAVKIWSVYNTLSLLSNTKIFNFC
jgi:hypothetical protein